ncbi:MAG: hypothetical protein RLZZ371_585 [Pseudomonadota bacterium]|jgi:hypothetical protein
MKCRSKLPGLSIGLLRRVISVFQKTVRNVSRFSLVSGLLRLLQCM